MTGFIISALVLLIVSLVFVVPTLLRKNQPFSDDYDDLNVSIAKDRLKEIKQQHEAGEINDETFQQLHDELESTLALDLANTKAAESTEVRQSRVVPVVVAGIVPVMAVVLYWQLGDFNAATGTAMTSVEIPEGENRPQMSIEEAIGKLQQRLKEQPDNADGWFMLAKTYMATQQYPQAVAAYQQTIELVGDEPQLLLGYADALAMTEGGRLTGAARPVLEKVIKLAPDSPTVLWMAGTAESQQGNYSKALNYWYRLQPMLVAEPDAGVQLGQLIAEAEKNLSSEEIAALKRAVPESVKQLEASSLAEITVNVDLSAEMKSRVADSDTLFIFAKAVSGPPMPLAAVKQTVAALPLTVKLNDAMAMMPQMKLSNFEQVTVSAVVSKSGQPGAKPGDLFAEVSPVSVNTGETVSLVINQVK